MPSRECRGAIGAELLFLYTIDCCLIPIVDITITCTVYYYWLGGWPVMIIRACYIFIGGPLVTSLIIVLLLGYLLLGCMYAGTLLPLGFSRLERFGAMSAFYLLAFLPLLLCLNWASFMVFSACVPTMIYCALWAPHLTRHAIALAFTATNVANLLPVGTGVAWNHWPTLLESTRLAATPQTLQTMVWWLALLLLCAWLSRHWLRQTLTGRALVRDAQARTRQH